MIVKPKIFRDTGTYKVRFHYLDIENGVLVDKIVERYVNAGDTAIAPPIPTSLSAVAKKSCALTFNSWNHTVLTNIQRDLDVGAIYDTTDGKTHAFVTVTATTGLALPIYFNKSDGSTLTISWGDGTSDYTTTSSGNLNTTHTYSAVGNYEITMWISSGTGTYSFGNASNTTTFIGGNTLAYRQTLNSLFIGNHVITLSDYSFFANGSIDFVTIPEGVTNIGRYSFHTNRFNYLSVPSSVTSIGEFAFRYCRTLRGIFLPSTVTTLGASIFVDAYSLESICIPELVTSITGGIFENNYSLKSVSLGSSVTTIGTYLFGQCHSLVNINLPLGLTTIEASAFYWCEFKRITVPDTVTSIGASAFSTCECLEHVVVPEGVGTIYSNTFSSTFSLNTLTLKRYTAPSTITTLDNTDAFTNTNAQLRIYVPVGSLSVYQNATNWSTFANRMYEDTPENRALFGD